MISLQQIALVVHLVLSLNSRCVTEALPTTPISLLRKGSTRTSTTITGASELQTDNSWVNWKDMDHKRYLMLLSAANIVSTVVAHPFHVVTMRQQAGRFKTHVGFFGNFKKSFNDLGYAGICRGWLPLALEIPSYATYYAVTELSRERLTPWLSSFKIPTVYKNSIQSILSSILSNMVSLLTWVPSEIITVKLLTYDTKPSFASIATDIYQSSGLSGFYIGYSTSLLVHVVYSFFWWFSYSSARQHLEKYMSNRPVVFDAVTGMIAGVCSSVLSHPFETIKLRVHSGEQVGKGVLEIVQLILRVEGLKGLFGGVFEGAHSGAISSAVFCVACKIILLIVFLKM